MARTIFGLLLAGCMGMLPFLAVAAEPVPFRAMAKVELDDAGVPIRVEVVQALPALIRERIEDQVMRYRFEPGSVNGQPAGGSTYVQLDACLVAQEDGSSHLAVNFLSNGPGYVPGQALMPPRYPPSAARDGATGEIRVVMQVLANGRSRLDSLEAITGREKPFARALKEWVEGMRWIPEQVGGQAVETRIATVAQFSLGRRDDAGVALSNACLQAQGEVPAQVPVALDSPFRPLSTI